MCHFSFSSANKLQSCLQLLPFGRSRLTHGRSLRGHLAPLCSQRAVHLTLSHFLMEFSPCDEEHFTLLFITRCAKCCVATLYVFLSLFLGAGTSFPCVKYSVCYASAFSSCSESTKLLLEDGIRVTGVVNALIKRERLPS
jgi:hypothetical protein